MTVKVPTKHKLTRSQRMAFRDLEKRHWAAPDAEKEKYLRAIAVVVDHEDASPDTFSADDILHLPLSFVVAKHLRGGRPFDMAAIYRDALALCV